MDEGSSGDAIQGLSWLNGELVFVEETAIDAELNDLHIDDPDPWGLLIVGTSNANAIW